MGTKRLGGNGIGGDSGMMGGGGGGGTTRVENSGKRTWGEMSWGRNVLVPDIRQKSERMNRDNISYV